MKTAIGFLFIIQETKFASAENADIPTETHFMTLAEAQESEKSNGIPTDCRFSTHKENPDRINCRG
jgi:hypothetical protein